MMDQFQEQQYIDYSDYTPLSSVVRVDSLHRRTVWGSYPPGRYDDQYNSTSTTSYANSTDLKLTFLLPVIFILFCVCITSLCGRRPHQMEPLDFDELQISTESGIAYIKELKRARIKKALKDNNVLMVRYGN